MRKFFLALLFLAFVVPQVHAAFVWTELGTATTDFHRVGRDAGSTVWAGSLLNFNKSIGIGAVRVYISAITGTPNPLTCQIQTNSGGNPSGTLANTGLNSSIPYTQVVAGTLNEIDFPSQINLTANTAYWLVCITAGNEGANDQYHPDYSTVTGDAAGRASFATAGVWTAGAAGSNYRASYGFNYSVLTTTIYLPANITYYNGTSTSQSFSLNSTSNSTSMATWRNLNGVAAFLGYTANGTVNVTTVSGLQNGQNNLTLTAFDGATNITASSFFTLFNGLNITVYNASQASTTYLSGVAINVSNATNSSTSSNAVTPLLIDTRTIPNSQTNQTVDITITKPGYQGRLFAASASSGNNSLFSYSYGLWRLQEFKALSSNGSSVTTFTFVVTSGTNITTYSTTNGSVYVSLSDIPFGSFTGAYTATGVNATNVTFTANASSEINYTASVQQAGLIIYVFDEASCLSTCQRIYFGYTATNGTNTTTDYSSLYFVNATYNTFPQGTVTFTFNNSANGSYQPRSYLISISSATAQIFNAYLLNASASTIFATYCVQTYQGIGISGARITIQRSISGSYVTVAQATAGSNGCSTFFLDALTSYQLVVTATGYTSFTGTSQPTVAIQTIYLTVGSATLGFQTAYADTNDLIQTKLLPVGRSLSGDWVLVNFTVYSWNSTLTNWGLNCNYNGTTIYNTNVTTSPAGGSTTTNVSLLNKTGTFYCFGLFDRTGYNTSYVNATYYVNVFNTTFLNVSIYQILNTTASGAWSPQLKGGLAILSTLGIVIWAGAVTGGAAAGLIAIFCIAVFAMLGFIAMGILELFILIGLAFAWFTSRAY